MCELSVYTGKEGDASDTNLGAKVVKKLTRSIVGHNHHIYCDNYFTSISLIEDLLQDSTYACGTFRRDRKGVQHDIKNACKLGIHPTHTHTHTHTLVHTHSHTHTLVHTLVHTHTHTHANTHAYAHKHYSLYSHHSHTHTKAGLQRGESIFRQKENLVACVWQDKRPVYVMSTNCQAIGNSTVRRKQKDGSITTVPCPPCVVCTTNSWVVSITMINFAHTTSFGQNPRSFTPTFSVFC